MIEGISDPVAYGLAVVCFGGWILVAVAVKAMFSGRLRTQREAEALLKRAETAEAAMRVRDEQVNAALAVLPKVLEIMEKIHQGGEEMHREREGS